MGSSAKSSFGISWVALGLFVAVCGCLPKPQVRELTGPLTAVEANLQFTKMRRQYGATYKSELEWNGKPFVAEWELGTTLQRTQQLQIKPSTKDFSVTELAMALEVALNDADHCPWHPVIFDAILSAYRRALLNQDAAGAFDENAPPYAMTVKVKDNGSEWFCQVKGSNEAPDAMKGGAN